MSDSKIGRRHASEFIPGSVSFTSCMDVSLVSGIEYTANP